MLEKVACPCDGGTLDRLIQPAILVLLADGPLHGYLLTERISKLPGFAGQKPDTSGVYRFLNTMERRGLVASVWDAPEKGPAKKSYQLTAAGADCLRRWIKTLENHRRRISAFLVAARKVSPRQPRELCCDEQ